MHSPCNLLSPSPPEQIKRITKGSSVLVNSLRECPHVSWKKPELGMSPTAVERRPMLIHTCYTVPMPRPCRAVPWPWEVGFEAAWSENGMGASWVRYGFCELNTVALSFPYDLHRATVFNSHKPYRAHDAPKPCSDHTASKPTSQGHGTARHGHGMGTVWHVWINIGRLSTACGRHA
jgi:hypothetical protein